MVEAGVVENVPTELLEDKKKHDDEDKKEDKTEISKKERRRPKMSKTVKKTNSFNHINMFGNFLGSCNCRGTDRIYREYGGSYRTV